MSEEVNKEQTNGVKQEKTPELSDEQLAETQGGIQAVQQFTTPARVFDPEWPSTPEEGVDDHTRTSMEDGRQRISMRRDHKNESPDMRGGRRVPRITLRSGR